MEPRRAIAEEACVEARHQEPRGVESRQARHRHLPTVRVPREQQRNAGGRRGSEHVRPVREHDRRLSGRHRGEHLRQRIGGLRPRSVLETDDVETDAANLDRSRLVA